MRRTQSALVIGIMLLLVACETIPSSPTPQLPPTNTISPFVTVIVTAPPVTLPPTWTPRPTFTSPPTATRLPTHTPRPTTAPIPTATIVGGRPGIVTIEGLLAVAISADAIAEALNETRRSFLFSSSINNVPIPVALGERVIQVGLNFNDYTVSGVPADFRLGLRVFNDQLLVDVISYETSTGDRLPPAQVESARQILRRAMIDQVIPAAVRRFQPDMTEYVVIGASIEPERVLVTVRITATLTETPEAAVPES